jgi:hypothetical protein
VWSCDSTALLQPRYSMNLYGDLLSLGSHFTSLARLLPATS